MHPILPAYRTVNVSGHRLRRHNKTFNSLYVETLKRPEVKLSRLGIRQSFNLESLGLEVIYNRRINNVGHMHVQFQASQVQSVPHLR